MELPALEARGRRQIECGVQPLRGDVQACEYCLSSHLRCVPEVRRVRYGRSIRREAVYMRVFIQDSTHREDVGA